MSRIRDPEPGERIQAEQARNRISSAGFVEIRISALYKPDVYL
jgi:hypothetical protein